MSKQNRAVLYSAVTITILLLMTAFASVNLIPDNNTLNCESPDFTNLSAHSHINLFEDDVPYIEPVTKPSKSEICKEFHLIATRSFTSIYYSEIWRPPKNS